MIIHLGNHEAKEGHPDNETGEVTYSALEGQRVTTVALPDDLSTVEAVITITSPRGVWAAHSSAPPAWVASDNELLEAVLAQHYGCERGEPDSLEANYHTGYGPPGVGPDGPVKSTKKGGK